MKKKLLLPVMILLALGAQGRALVAAEHAPGPEGYVRLLTSNGAKYKVKVGVVRLSKMLDDALGYQGAEDIEAGIPLPYRSTYLRPMIQIMRTYKMEPELLLMVINAGRLLKDSNIIGVLKLANDLDFEEHPKIMDAIIDKFIELKLADYKVNPLPINHRPEGYKGKTLSFDLPPELLLVVAKAYFIRERFDKRDKEVVPLKLAFDYGFSIRELADLGRRPGIKW